MSEILMPALSPTMESGTLAKWCVAVGDSIRAGDIIAEIETDKATMEVEATEEGVIAALLVAAGTEEVAVRTPIARLAGDGDGAAPIVDPAPAADRSAAAAPVVAVEDPKLSPSARRIISEENLDASQIQGSGPGGRVLKADALEAVANRKPVTPADATPLARKLAEAAGVDLSARSASGNRIRKADLVRPREPEPVRAPPSPAGEESSVRALVPSPRIDGRHDIVPLDGMRRTIAQRMTESFRDIPHFPLTIDLEIDALLAVRGQVNAALASQGIKVSVNDILIKAAAVALRQVPEANASYTPEGIALHHHADISVAVAVDGGLITPIIRAAETKGLGAISREMRDLADRARSRRLKPEEFQGGTFSISNLGMFGISSFSSIINTPQGAILSVGAAEPRPVVREGSVAIATLATCTLTCDHRAMDGATGARLLAALRQIVREPLLLMA